MLLCLKICFETVETCFSPNTKIVKWRHHPISKVDIYEIISVHECCLSEQYFTAKLIFVYQLLTLRCLEVKNILSFQCSATVNRFFPKTWAAHFSCFCCQSMEIQFQNIKTIEKRPSKTLNSFLWCNPSLLYRVVGSILPKHFNFAVI